MAKRRWTYWGGFAALAAGSLALLFLFVFGFLPQRFLLELDFAESGYSYPVVRPQSPLAATPEAVPAPTQPVPRAPAERFWAEYLNFTRSGESEAALRLLAGYLEEYPVDVGARLEYARALWRQGDLEAAAAEYRQALANSASLATKRELARLLVTARDWDAALELYEELARRAARRRGALA